MFLHDICDVFLDGGKLANALGLPVEPFFVLFIGVWVATRLYLFPAVVVRSVLFEARPPRLDTQRRAQLHPAARRPSRARPPLCATDPGVGAEDVAELHC